MIVNVPLHAAYVYDMLAILMIKSRESYTETNNRNAENMSSCLGQQVGKELHHQIMWSEEYLNLYRANLAVFQRIDEIKKREATGADATFIDEQNYNRYLAKQALRSRFFPDVPMEEQKLGYDLQWRATHGGKI
jgi:hypothetical protein